VLSSAVRSVGVCLVVVRVCAQSVIGVTRHNTFRRLPSCVCGECVAFHWGELWECCSTNEFNAQC
jgi:hypothetical protein